MYGRYLGYLEEAEDIGSLGVVRVNGGTLVKLCRKRRTLAKGPVLYSRCKEGR